MIILVELIAIKDLNTVFASFKSLQPKISTKSNFLRPSSPTQPKMLQIKKKNHKTFRYILSTINLV